MTRQGSEKEISHTGNEYSSLKLSNVMPEVYNELRRLARHYMAREKAGQTLQATALVNEAYLKLAKEKEHFWKNRSHFCAIAANAMRELLVEKARARAASKRGGSRVRVSFENVLAPSDSKPVDLLVLHEALERLGVMDPQLAQIVEIRFFGGLTIEEAAQHLNTSQATVKRGWTMAKAWLKHEMEKHHGS
jgi:RNA polymerase sigma-70 factor, ECF subfamily